MGYKFANVVSSFLHRNELIVSIIFFFFVLGVILLPLFSYSIINTVTGIITDYSDNTIYHNASAQLNQIYNTIDTMLDSTVKDFYYYYNYDTDFSSVLRSENTSWKEMLEAASKLRHKINSNPLIASAYLINKKSRNIYSITTELDYSGILPVDNFYDKDILDRLMVSNINRDIVFIPRHVQISLFTKSIENDYLSIVFSKPAFEKPLESIIVVNIHQRMLQDLLNSTETSPGNLFFIVNNDGYIVSHTSPERVNRWTIDMKYVTSVLESPEESGSCSIMINGRKNLVSFKKAEKYGIVFFAVSDYTKLTHVLQDFNQYICIYTIICVLVCVGAAIIAIRKIYIPLRQLLCNIRRGNNYAHEQSDLNEYEYLAMTYDIMEKNLNLLKNDAANAQTARKNEIIRMLMNHEYNTIDECKAGIESCGITLEYSYFQVLGFQFEGIVNFDGNYSMREAELLRFTLGNITREIFGEVFPVIGEMYDKTTDYFLINLSSNDQAMQEKLYKKITVIQETIRNHMWFNISVYLGDVVENLLQVSESKKQAMTAGKYRLVYGMGSIIKYTDIADREKIFYDYSRLNERDILDAIRQKDLDKCNTQLEIFFRELKNASADDILFYTVQLSNMIIHTLNTVEEKSGVINYREFNRRLMGCDTIQEIEQFIKVLVKRTIDMHKEIATRHYIDLVNDLIRYVDENYHVKDLTVEDIAAYARISANYVRQLFREYLDQSPIDYLISVRIKKAEELLINTDEPASSIAAKVGYSDNRYFYYVFKKKTGYTTSEYREIMGGKQKSVQEQLVMEG